MTLFDLPPDIEPAPSLEQQFATFHAAHPEVFTELHAMTLRLLALRAERTQMAMHEAGFPQVRMRVRDGLVTMFGADRDPVAITAVNRALRLAGGEPRCLPCALFAPSGSRVSPDCEGTGRCAEES